LNFFFCKFSIQFHIYVINRFKASYVSRSAYVLIVIGALEIFSDDDDYDG